MGIDENLEKLAKAYGIAATDVKTIYDKYAGQGDATAVSAFKLTRRELEETFGLLEEPAVPTEKPAPPATEGATIEIKELLEGGAAEGSKIAEIEVKEASEFFGEKAKDPKRMIAKIKADNDADLTVSIPKGMTYSDGAWKVLNKLQATRSIRNKASKFGAFLRKYGKWPNVGIEVETDLDDEGFARIVV